MTRLGSAFAIVLAIGAGVPERSSAELIQVDFTGFVTSVSPEITALFDSLDGASGPFVIDTDLPDNNSSPELGEYVGTPFDVTFHFSGSTWSAGGAGPGDSVLVRNEPGQDGLQVNVLSPIGPSTNGYVASNLGFSIRDDDGLSFASDAMPASIDAADFATREAYISFFKSGFPFATVTASVTFTVPEPGPIAAALAAIATLRRRSYASRIL